MSHPSATIHRMNATNNWLRVLRDLGYEVKVDSGGDLRWVDDGLEFYCMVELDFPTYLRIVLLGVWRVTAATRHLVPQAALVVNDVNARVKVAKLIFDEAGVYGSAEALYPTPDIGGRHVHDLMTMLRVAGQLFSDEFPEGWPPETAADGDADDEEKEEQEPWRGSSPDFP